jgi:hypothetical protein
MDMFNDLLGGGGGSRDKRSEYEDFIGRFERGAPYEGIGDEEAVQRYREVDERLDDDQYRDSAEAAFARLSPQERQEFARYMRERTQGRGVDAFGAGRDDDPAELARMTSRVRKEDPGILEQLMGRGGTGGPLDNPIAKAAFAGIAAMAASKFMGRR